ncbi:prephenate dehydrogenase/arogenate dehydrogenase family protein [Candidatus Chloroploca sp. M-50]|uniref:Prephenate dehydrogenase/arogenate dehydrogenase family protein n=1 Tax=Candidatus Chloroploca mongolica TaxID=2528176 RepID=A0ABS4D928_9CHLR|nr:prephenate dehydrogenase/arogenate dehydrogenase family protein [Candidatus Chloroploca mongolica]MBP1465920.1 prephenate dehydrogenase/arogenate dehydrogenase family protein [Candidatus Chloroploca mongolica]
MVRISIIGLGLIGTSLGMALRSAEVSESPLGALEVVGWDRDQRAVKEARGRLAIDREARTLVEAVRDAQIIVVATPVLAIREVFAQLGPLLASGTVVTDVASTKAEVAHWAESLPLGVAYVGGHPMAGKEKAGAAAADPDLFKGAIYCLTTGRSTPQAALEAVEAMVRTVGAKPYYIDPEEHDVYVAGISHLPMLLSVGLVEITGRSPAWKEMAALAATGFRDVSRLASGDPEMHRDILLTNRVGLNRWIDEMISFLLEVRDQVDEGDAEAIEPLLQRVREQREGWLETRPGLRPGEDAFLDQPEPERRNLLTFRLPRRRP